MSEPTVRSCGPKPLELPAGVHQLCSCGRSHHGWFCDGTHLGTVRVSYVMWLSTPTKVLMCRCGHSHRYPLCDGNHGVQSRKPWWQPWG
jgi:CDGSH-type Zn-finger protein